MAIVLPQRLKQYLGMCNILTCVLDCNKIAIVLTSEQYVFQDGVSTNNSIYKLINSVYEAWNN